MSKPAFTREENTRQIRPERWNTFLAEFTRQYRGAHARLEVIGNEVGARVITEDRPFDGISADSKDGERTVWIMFGPTPETHLTHGVQDASAIWVLDTPEHQPRAALEVESRDGIRTVLELTWPEEYALPPGKSTESRK
jgi:hypothetical protein